MNPLGHIPSHFHPTGLEYRHRPAEWCPLQRGWFQDGRKLRNVKATKAFVWPKDGRMDTPWGRFKDILKGQGPDMYLTFNADKHDYMVNRPTRGQWSGWRNPEDDVLQPLPLATEKWAQAGLLDGRSPFAGKAYDFRTRKYGRPNRYTWTDAIWQPDQRNNKYNRFPEAVRDVYGQWWQDHSYLPQWKGGPVHTAQGKGRFDFHKTPHLM